MHYVVHYIVSPRLLLGGDLVHYIVHYIVSPRLLLGGEPRRVEEHLRQQIRDLGDTRCGVERLAVDELVHVACRAPKAEATAAEEEAEEAEGLPGRWLGRCHRGAGCSPME